MLDVHFDLGVGVVDDLAVSRVRPVARCDVGFHDSQGLEVNGEVFEDGRAVAEDVIAREDGGDLRGVGGGGDDEGHVVCCVAGAVEGAQGEGFGGC